MKLAKYLANLGYGSRREVTAMLEDGRVTRADGMKLAEGDAFLHADARVDGEPLDPPPGVVIMLHKPVGYVCSTTDMNPLVYDLLPGRFRERSPVIAPVGRLDRDTSGLLLLTDSGQMNHRLSSPKAGIGKVYVAGLASDLRGDEADLFASGTLMLNDEAVPLAPVILEALDARRARVTLKEGRYHQVRRMFAAVGNHVETLHRSAIGAVGLGDLPMGAWRPLDETEVAGLTT
ncbi:MAG: rRNA pseudouridine synthase [Gemmatimonadetes bacterium]|nr:rRNA pseudouridine synthase [Gemmatimonadota bacterium]